MAGKPNIFPMKNHGFIDQDSKMQQKNAIKSILTFLADLDGKHCKV